MSTETKTPPVEKKTDTAAASAAIAKAAPKKTFQDLIDGPKFKEQIALALPKHLTVERFIRVLMTATIKAPLLLQCTQDSLFKGIFDAAAAGLEIDGRRAHLVPFKNHKKGIIEAVLIPDYKGVAELAMRSGVVSSIHADLVCDNDEFEYDRGELKKHKIDFKKDRGKPYAYYVIIRMKDGGEKVEVMSKPQVDQIRRRSKSADEGPWVTDYDAMALKTVFKRASKWIPLSAEIRNVLENEDDHTDTPIDVTPKASLAGLIGAPGADTPEMSAEGAITKPEGEGNILSQTAANIQAAQKNAREAAVEVKTYTPEEREKHLTACQTAMLDCSVSESKVMLYVHSQKLAKEGQDELGTLGTDVLEALRVIIPTLAGGKTAEKK